MCLQNQTRILSLHSYTQRARLNICISLQVAIIYKSADITFGYDLLYY